MTWARNSDYTRPTTYPLKTATIDPLLVQLLSLCTPHKYEKHIARIIVDTVNKKPHTHTIENLNGNILITVGDKDPKTMFSCHMDMIGGIDKRNMEKDRVDGITLMTDVLDKGYIWGAKKILDGEGEFLKYESSTLGADDKVGVYINLKMIENNIPGLYVFHIGEEVGGVGSEYLSKQHKDRFVNIKRAIAFDRANYSDVICFQRGGRCCSDIFGKALAEMLNTNMPKFEKYKSGVTGTFTDTANYRTIIPECTNISVGYFNQHGVYEKLDYVFLKHILLPSILKANFDSLPTARDPKETYSYSYSRTNTNNATWNSKRKSWKEATNDTTFWEFPKWNPKEGFVKEAKEEVLTKAIRNYIMDLSTLSMKDKDDFAEYIYELMLYNDTIKDECISQAQQIRLMTGKTVHGKQDVKFITRDSKISDIDVAKRKEYVKSLVEAGKYVAFASESNKQRIMSYSRGGDHFLATHKNKTTWKDFSAKEIKKLNRIIFTLSYCLSLENTNAAITELLIAVEDYISKHCNEEGFTWSENAKSKAVH